jgi:hypothetical protein
MTKIIHDIFGEPGSSIASDEQHSSAKSLTYFRRSDNPSSKGDKGSIDVGSVEHVSKAVERYKEVDQSLVESTTEKEAPGDTGT